MPAPAVTSGGEYDSVLEVGERFESREAGMAESAASSEPLESGEPVAVGRGIDEQEPDEGMVGLRWFANWRQGIDAKGAV